MIPLNHSSKPAHPPDSFQEGQRKQTTAQDQMSRGTLPSLNQTGEGFLFTFELGPHNKHKQSQGHKPSQVKHMGDDVLDLAKLLSLALLVLDSTFQDKLPFMRRRVSRLGVRGKLR